jgi:putative transposase
LPGKSNHPGDDANEKLALAIGEVGWSKFKSMLEYKAGWYGKNIIFIGRFEPSSKMCSHCGATNK